MLELPNVNYAQFVNRLCKSGDDILKTLTPLQAHLWHMATGVAGEGGELLDAFKKHCVYGKPLDLANVVEELGDLEFFMQEIRTQLGITREEVIEHNMQKLGKRYNSLVYSDLAAQTRADKAGE